MDVNSSTIINIQKYSIHDGPGIRTTVFFKDVHSNVGGVIILKLKIQSMK